MTIKTIFFGTPDFSLQSLQACFDKTDLLAIVSKKDKKRGRGQKISSSPCKEFALKHNIPCFTPWTFKKDNQELRGFNEFVKNNKIDFFIVTAYGKILPQKILNLPTQACLNVHASLLPKYRGAAPIQRSLENGDFETGLSLQKMVFELDAGDVVDEIKTPIDINENSLELTQRLSSLSYNLLTEFFNKYSLDQQMALFGKKQNAEMVTYAEKISKEEGFYKDNWSAKKLHNTTRAFSAWPKVKAKLSNDKELTIHKTCFIEIDKNSISSSKNQLIIHDQKLVLHCFDDNFIELKVIQFPGKSKGPAFELMRQQLQSEELYLKSN